MHEVGHIFDSLYSYGESNSPSWRFSFYMFASILMVVNGTFDGVSQWAISPGSEPSPMWQESTMLSIFTVGLGQKTRPPNLMRENEKEMELKFCSPSHTHEHMVYTMMLKRNTPRLRSMLNWPSPTFTLAHVFPNGLFLMQDQSSHGLTLNLSLIDTQTDPNTHDYWPLKHMLYPSLISSLINERFPHVCIKMLIWDKLANVAVSQGVKACRGFVSLTGWSYWVFDLSFMKCQQHGSELK